LPLPKPFLASTDTLASVAIAGSPTARSTKLQVSHPEALPPRARPLLRPIMRIVHRSLLQELDRLPQATPPPRMRIRPPANPLLRPDFRLCEILPFRFKQNRITLPLSSSLSRQQVLYFAKCSSISVLLHLFVCVIMFFLLSSPHYCVLKFFWASLSFI